MLTKRQYSLLSWIQSYMDEHFISPSYEEMRIGIGTASKSEIYRLIKGIKERGFIKSLPLKARSIEVIRRVK